MKRWTRIGLITAGIALAAWWGLIPLLDPSVGQTDVALCHALEKSLNGGLDPPARSGHFFEDVSLKLEPLSEAEFRRRVEAVPGWDLLVIYRPYQQRGEQLPHADAVSSWWLRRRITRIDGFDNEGNFYVLVVRNQSVVGSLYLETDMELHGVVVRSL